MATSTTTTTTTVQVILSDSSTYPDQISAPASTKPSHTETLTLRLMPKRKNKKGGGVKWSEEVVDNEFMGKKSSKKCCIFHRQRAFGEWSDGEDSDNNDDQECGSSKKSESQETGEKV